MKEGKRTQECGCEERRSEEVSGHAVPADVRHAMEAIAPYEKKLLAALRNGATNRLFLEAPEAVFNQLEIPISPVLARLLRRHVRNRVEDLTPQTFLLPNGQRITPRVNVRITAGVKGE